MKRLGTWMLRKWRRRRQWMPGAARRSTAQLAAVESVAPTLTAPESARSGKRRGARRKPGAVLPLEKPDVRLGPEGRAFDAILLVVVITMVGMGLVMVYSSSAIKGELQFGDEAFFLRRQIWHVAFGLVLMMVGLGVDYRWYKRLIYPVLGSSVLMLVLVLLIGHEYNNAQRWLRVGGVTFQPSEWVKVSLIMYMAYSIDKKGYKIKKFSIGFIPHLLILGVMALLLLKQPDFGTVVICATMMFIMLFVGGARAGYIAMFVLLGAVAAAYGIVTSSYRMERVQAYLDPWKDPHGASYQISQSLTAIGSGGLTGKGLGAGHSKLGYVPELWNDFIATAVGEELGLLGLLMLCVLVLMLVWRGLKIAFGAREMFGMYLAFGLTTLFGLQSVVNLCVVTGLLPNKGLTLPFISYGGSSMFVSLFVIGVLLNISQAREDTWEADRAERERIQMEKRLEKKRKRYARTREVR